MIKSVSNIESPRPHVFAVLMDFPRYKEWMPGCVESKVISKSGNTIDTELTIESMKKLTLGLRFDVHENQLLNFRMTSGKELKSYTGSWRLLDSADGTGTVVMGEMEMDVGGMVPGFLLNRIVKKSVEETAAALGRRTRALPVQQTVAASVSAPNVPRRSKRILHVMKIVGGYRVWVMGETLFIQNRP